MKNYINSTYALAVAAVIIGLIVVQWNSVTGVPPCINTPACNIESDNIGKLTKKEYGYPLTYRSIVTFEPTRATQYAMTSVEPVGFSVVNVIVNSVFWFALLSLAVRIYNGSAADTKKR